jgi:competence ComEA-like helix-hairpin-helix protein
MRRPIGLLASCLVLLAAASPAGAAKAVDGVVNLNTADVGVLGLLPGIGPAKAAQIVVYRKRHPFRTVDELVRIKGIGRKMVRRLRVHLAVSGPTTAHAVRRPISFDLPPPAPPAPPPRKPGTAGPAGAAPKAAKPTAKPTVVSIARARVPAASSRERRSRADHCARPP